MCKFFRVDATGRSDTRLNVLVEAQVSRRHVARPGMCACVGPELSDAVRRLLCRLEGVLAARLHDVQEKNSLQGAYQEIRSGAEASKEREARLQEEATQKSLEKATHVAQEALLSAREAKEQAKQDKELLEAALLAQLGKTWEEVTPEDYLSLIHEAKLLPRVVRFN